MALDIRPLDFEADLERVLPLWNLNRQVAQTAEALRAIEARLEATPWYRLRLIGEVGGEALATGSLVESGQSRAGWLIADVTVAPRARGRGYGRAMAARIAAAAMARGAVMLEAFVRDNEPDARAWAERRGFRLHAHQFDARLDLARVDLTSLDGRLRALRERGLALCTAAALGDGEEVSRRLLEAYVRDLRRMAGAEDWQPPSLDDWQRFFVGHPEQRREAIFLALDRDEIVGQTWLRETPGGAVHTVFTGVAARHEGTGVAAALKLWSLAYARARGARTALTNNLSTNTRILALNRALGYEPLPGTWWLRRAMAAPESA